MKLGLFLISILFYNISFGDTVLVSKKELCNKLTPELVETNHFKVIPNGTNYGFNRNCVVGKLIFSQQVKGKKYLVFDLPHIKNLNLFYYNKKNKVINLRSGSKVRSSERNNPYFRPTFLLDMGSLKNNTVFFQIKNVGTIRINYKLFDKEHFTEQKWMELTFFITFLAVILSMIFQNLFFFVNSNSKDNILYPFYLIIMFFTLIFNNGFQYQYIFGDYINLSINSIPFAVGAGLIINSILFSNFLELKKYFPTGYKISIAFIYIGILGMVGVFIPQFHTNIILNLSVLFSNIWFPFSALYIIRRNIFAKYFLLSFIPYFACLTIEVFQNFGIIAPHYIYFYISNIGFFIHMVLFGLFLGSKIKFLKKNVQKYENDLSLLKLANQVSHDIRSPLAAIHMITKEIDDALPETTRLILRGSVNRIQDIANNLLQQFKKGTHKSSGDTSIILLSPLIDEIISEKRTELRSKLNINLQSHLENSYGIFAKINPSHMKRLLSNLVNNSIEAFDSNGGSVTLSLIKNCKENFAEITVSDNGKGIPHQLIPKLFHEGSTFGKTKNKNSGSGIGLFHAKSSAESWGGCIKLNSLVGEGTDVILRLPLASTPNWFVPKIVIRPNQNIVILDDDSTIHKVWNNKFSKLGLDYHNINVLNFSDPEDFIKWYGNNNKKFLFLCDYEFLGHNSNGLDVIEKLNISSNSILITSRYGEKEVILKSEKLDVGLVPKLMAELLPIEIHSNLISQESKYDLVYLDDDKFLRMAWKMEAKKKSKKILSLSELSQLENHLPLLDLETPFFLDQDLGEDKASGITISKTLHEKGFKNLYLCTGYRKQDLPDLPWIKDVLPKNVNFSQFL